MLKKIALAVTLVCNMASAQQTATGTTALEPGVIYNTGNIVQQTTTSTGSTWTGAVYQDNLTCWYGGDPGYCGPNAIVRPGNALNFSYGSTYVYQQQHISTLLPSSTGLQVNGYNFGFTAKNGNGWDGGGTDSLMALVRFWDNTGGKGAGNLLYGTSYNLNYNTQGWRDFNYSETFNKPLAVPDVGLVQYGFIGRDNNGWAGPYGPEIYNISFSVKYSVDPCLKDPLYSPTCPGYLEALNKLLPQTTTVVSDPVASIATTATVVTEPVVSTTNTSATSSAVSTGQPSIVASVVSAPAPSSSTSSTSSTSATSQAKESSSSGGSTSLALSIISKNSERDAAGSAVAQSAVSQAQAAATQAQQEAATVAASAVANSTTANAVAVGSQQSNGTGIKINNANSNSTNFTLQSGVTSLTSSVGGPQTTNNNTAVVQQQSSSGLGLNVSNNQPVIVTNVGTQQTSISESVTTFALPLLQPQQSAITTVTPSVFATVEQPQVQQTLLQSSSTTSQSTESYAVVPPNFLTDKSNPLTDIVEGKNTVPQTSTIATTGPSVNRNTSDNEVAGGVDLNKMALAPAGYGDYLSLTLRDAAFYAPKEVYKNQRNVDNARLLRLLTNDSKHKEMVELQYGK